MVTSSFPFFVLFISSLRWRWVKKFPVFSTPLPNAEKGKRRGKKGGVGEREREERGRGGEGERERARDMEREKEREGREREGGREERER